MRELAVKSVSLSYQDVDAAGADEGAGDLQRLFGVVRLRDQEIVDVYPEVLGVSRIQGVLHVHERGHPSGLLRLSHQMESDRGFA